MARKVPLLALIASFAASVALSDHYSSGREIAIPFPRDTSPAVRHFLPDIACGADQCLVVWKAINDGQRLSYEIRAARISRAGQLLDLTSLIVASVSSQNTTPPQVVALASDYVVFYSGIQYARINRNGVVTRSNAKTSISTELASVNEAVAAGGSILLYSVENRGPLVPYLTLLDEKLEVVRELKVDGQPTDVAVAGNGFVVASATVDGLKVTRLAADGTIGTTSAIPVWNAAGVLAATSSSVLVAWRRPPTNDGPATTEFATITSDGKQRFGVLDKSISLSSSLDVASTAAGYLVLWSRPSNGYYTDQAYGARIDSAGQVLDAAPVALSSKSPLQIQARCAAIDSGFIALWIDWRFGHGHDHVFAAPVPASGSVGSDFLVSRLLVSQSNAVLATTGGVTGVAWREAAGTGAGAVMFLRTRADGTPLDAAPLRLSEAGGPPALATYGGNFIVAWREWGVARVAIAGDGGHITLAAGIGMRGIGDISAAAGPGGITLMCDYENTMFAGYVRYDGTVVSPDPRPIGPGVDPRIAFDGEDYWVVYRNDRVIAARRLSDTLPFTLTTEATHDQLAIACGKGTCAALWRTLRGDQNAIEGALLTAGGAVPAIVAARADDVAHPALAWNGDGYLVSWSARGDIHAGQLSASGNIGHSSAITETDSDESAPAVSASGATRVFAYSRASSDAGARLYLRFDGDPPRRRSVRR